MSGHRKAIEILKPSLTKAIEEWIEEACETEEWEALGIYVGDDTDTCMSDAAMAVLSAVVDMHQWHRDNETDFGVLE